jgi:hypothetical protein
MELTISKYQKKPVIITAIQWTGTEKDFEDIKRECPNVKKLNEEELLITTLEGDMIASLNDFIIKGIGGEFYPCKPDIFEKTYLKIESNK